MASLAPDGQTLLLTAADVSFQASSIRADQRRPVAGLSAGDRVVGWSRDSRAVFVQHGYDVPKRVERVDLRSGARATVRETVPEGIGALATLMVTDWVDKGRSYAYNDPTVPSTLFVVTGAVVP